MTFLGVKWPPFGGSKGHFEEAGSWIFFWTLPYFGGLQFTGGKNHQEPRESRPSSAKKRRAIFTLEGVVVTFCIVEGGRIYLEATLDIQSYLLRFGVLGIILGSKYRTSQGVWMCRGNNMGLPTKAPLCKHFATTEDFPGKALLEKHRWNQRFKKAMFSISNTMIYDDLWSDVFFWILVSGCFFGICVQFLEFMGKDA